MRIRDAINGTQTAPELFIKAVCAQAVSAGTIPYVLSYAPYASMNPFQRLLYSRGSECGYAVVPAIKISDLGKVNWDSRSVIHLHWLASILRGIKSEEEARSQLSTFEKTIVEWKSQGHKILWTMHNLLPHDAVHTKYEILLRKIIVRYTDGIHILSKASLDESKQFFDLPQEKTFHVPHPSYQNWYPNISDSVNARLDLGINPGEFVFLQFGSIQRYKGIDALICNYKHLESVLPHRRFRLIIAGKPVDKTYLSEIQRSIDTSLTIKMIPSPMEEREIQTLFNACDVVVAPYVSTLNSGIALLAATFEKALVAPKTGGILETYASDPTLLYSEEERDCLLNALIRSVEYSIDESIFTEILSRHRPARISEEFFSSVTKLFFEKRTTTSLTAL